MSQRGIVLLVVLSFATAQPTRAADPKKAPFKMPDGWGAYVRDEKGVMKNLVTPIEKNSDKDWMFLQFTDCAGPKKRLAVMPIENKTPTIEQTEKTKNAVIVTTQVAEVPVASIEEMLTTALANTHRFILLERKALDQTLAEQDFGESGRMASSSAAKIGRMLGAQEMIFGAVNEWSPGKSKTGGALGAVASGFLGGFGAKKKEAEIAMSFRIVDATTGEVLASITERAKTTSWGIGLGGAGGGGGGLFGYEKDSPINYAVMSCLNKIAYKIAMALKDRPWSGSVIVAKAQEAPPPPAPPPPKPTTGKTKKSTSPAAPPAPPPPPPPPPKIYLNAGTNAGIMQGMRMEIDSLGEEIVDPETGLTLDRERTRIGLVEVASVQDRLSIVSIVEGCAGIKNGDAAILVTPVPASQTQVAGSGGS